MDEYAEDLDGPRLPGVVEEYLAVERAWNRFVRGAGLTTAMESAWELARRVQD